MTPQKFKTWNLVLGWTAFAIAFITYALTVEPTVSFWDVGEYMLTSAKLQVGHPPGAPFFQMIGAVMSNFSPNPESIGFTLNLMSGFSAALTILFLFWTLVRLLFKVLGPEKTAHRSQQVAILGSAFVGSLAFAFTDSFWFNATEAEVYAMATLIMSALFYLGLRWEADMDEPRGNRWLLLISFIIGLSFGVHFMGLLTIPAIGLVYFYKRYQSVTVKSFLLANVAVVAVLAFIFKLLLPTALWWFGWMEVTIVNATGLPFHSGTILAGLILLFAFLYGLRYAMRHNKPQLQTGLLCFLFIFVGFSSWLMLPIRANAEVNINENDPSNARELLAYYNLEQYPKTYLFYGPLFTDRFAPLDELNPYRDAAPKYERNFETGTYDVVNDYANAIQNYNHEQAALLPRMHSPEHAKNYMRYTGLLDFSVRPEYSNEKQLLEIVDEFRKEMNAGNVSYDDYESFLQQFGSYLIIEKPSLADNLYFMVDFQFGFMYWRYLMWNFVGRQDDIQGQFDNHGNWISGINAIDEWHLGVSQDNLPSDVLNNKARNTYYFLPFLLGIIGLLFLYQKSKSQFWVLLVFFLFTGLAIQFYTNVRPFEPRERDYSVVGSFYVFAIWIGFGAYALLEMVQRKWNNLFVVPALTGLLLLAIPGLLASQNWDDHDRSDRETAHAMAVKYLESCAPNAILFTIGDNDSFPLWYAQEIEGIRTDVRVVNTSLLQTDWYIDQMKRQSYESAPIPSSIEHNKYRYGTRDYVIKEPITKDTFALSEVMNFITNDTERAKYGSYLKQRGRDLSQYRSQDLSMNFLPTENIRIPVNKENVLQSGFVKVKDSSLIVPYIDIKINDQAVYKNRLIMLDIINNNDWKRPIYFSGGAFGNDDYIWMKDYLQLEGMCYKLVPINTPVNPKNPYEMGRIDTDIMYNMVMKWSWGNSGEPSVYHDVQTRRNSISYRSNLARLAEQLLREKQFDKAEKLADLAMAKMPVDIYGYYSLIEPFILTYYNAGAEEKARALYEQVAVKYAETLNYYSGLKRDQQEAYFDDIYSQIEQYRSLVDTVIVEDQDNDYISKAMSKYNDLVSQFKYFMGDEEEEMGNDIPTQDDSSTTVDPNN